MFDTKMTFLIIQYVHYMFTLQCGVLFKGGIIFVRLLPFKNMKVHLFFLRFCEFC